MHVEFKRNMFGLSAFLIQDSDKTSLVVLDEDSDLDSRQRKRSTTASYWFRNPTCDSDQLAKMLQGIDGLGGQWVCDLLANKESTSFYAILKLEESAAQMWAFKGVSNWQKWDKTQEAEEKKARNAKPQKVKVNKDGSVKVRVSVTTLGDKDPD